MDGAAKLSDDETIISAFPPCPDLEFLPKRFRISVLSACRSNASTIRTDGEFSSIRIVRKFGPIARAKVSGSSIPYGLRRPRKIGRAATEPIKSACDETTAFKLLQKVAGSRS